MNVLAEFSLHHFMIAIPERGEEAARRFYGQLLGLVEKEKPENLRSRGGVWFTGGTFELHLGVEKEFKPARKAHPGLLTSDLNRVLKRLAEAGVEIVTDQPLEGFNRVYVNDPFGNRIELMEREDD